MEADDLGALVVFAGANIRYLTGSYQGNWKYNINIRYAVIPRNGEPYLFETAGSDMHNAMLDLPWMKDRIRPAMTWQWAEGAVSEMADKMVSSVMEVLKEHGVEKEKIGVDNLDFPALHSFEKAGLRIVNGWPAMSRARVVKTVDEIEQIKMSAAIGDAAMWHIKHEWLRPGVTETSGRGRSPQVHARSRPARSSTTSSSPRAATPARTAVGRPIRSFSKAIS